jgi:peptidoglycan/xylan/chitin deacetylase (PgdA/CDA1 family)
LASVASLVSLIKTAFFIALELGQINKLFRFFNRGKVKVLMYHSITERSKFFDNAVAPDDFLRQIRYLRKHYHVVPASALNQQNAYVHDRVNVVITFDDGFKDNRTVATEILRREGLSAIFFAIADCLEQGDMPSFLRRRLGNAASAPAYRTINSADVAEMLSFGMVIGAHGVRHEDYSDLDYSHGIEDAAEAQRLVQMQIGVAIENFAFPWGRYRKGQETDLLSIYQRVFLTDHGFNAPSDRVMFRNEVSSISQLGAAASGSLDFFRDLRPR